MIYPKQLVLAISVFFGLGIYVFIVELVINGMLLPSLLPFALGGAISGLKSIVPTLRAIYIILYISLFTYLVVLLFKREGVDYYV